MAKTVYCLKCGQRKDAPNRRCWNCNMIKLELKRKVEEYKAEEWKKMAEARVKPLNNPMPTYPYLPIEIFAIILIVQDGQFNGFVVDLSVQKQPKLRLAFGRDDRADTPYDTSVTAPNMCERIKKDIQEWYIRKYGTEGLKTANLSSIEKAFINDEVWKFLGDYVPPPDTPSSGPETREINGVTVTGYGLDNLELVLSPAETSFAAFPKNTNVPVKVLNAVKGNQVLSRITFGSLQAASTPPKTLKKAAATDIEEGNDTLYWLETKYSRSSGDPNANWKPEEEDPAKVRARYEATIAEAMRQDPKVAEAVSKISKSLASPDLAGFTDSEINQLNQLARASMASQSPSFRFINPFLQNAIGGAYGIDLSAFPTRKPQPATVDLAVRIRDVEDRLNAAGRSSVPNQRTSKALPAVQPTEFTRAIDLSDD